MNRRVKPRRALPVRFVTALVLTLVLCFSPASRADVASGDIKDRSLPRRPWWPFAIGPSYGQVAEAQLLDPRVIRLDVGSFDTRGKGLLLPEALMMTGEDALKPTAPWLVQLEGTITEEKKDALRQSGVRIYSYAPNNGFIVRSGRPGRLASLPGVLWAGPYHPAYRIEPTLGQAPTGDPEVAKNETIFVRALLFDPSERTEVIAALESLGAAIDTEATFDPHGWPDRVYFRAAPSAILAAARLDEVRWIEEVSLWAFTMNAESKEVMQSGFVSMGTPLWDAGVTGSTQVFGDMDEGLDVDTILVSNTASDAGTPGSSHRKVVAYTPYGGGDMKTCSCFTGYSHGTNTTQCVIGNRTDFGQSGDLEGVAHKAKVVFQDIGPSNSVYCAAGSLAAPASFISMYDQVRSLNGHMSNGSFSAGSGYCSAASDADQYTWDHKDYLMTFSAGNGGGIVCPGTAKNVISAGGHYQDPFYNQQFGSTGPAPGNRMAPTITAPACDFSNGNPPPYNYDTSASIRDTDCDITGTPNTIVNQGACGTSFSSPYSLGAALLVRDYFEKGYYPSGGAKASDDFVPSGALVKAVLLDSGELMTCSSCGSLGSNVQGMGRLNLSRTLSLSADTRTPQGSRAIDKGMSAGVATNGVYQEKIEVLDPSAPLRVTLNWTDPVGSSLVNNLRLNVTGPGGTQAQTFHGGNINGQFSRSEAAGGTVDDGVNPFESVFVAPADLVTGVWTAQVVGTNVPTPDSRYGNTQPFALVSSGGFSSSGAREVSPPGSSSPLRVTSASGSTVNWQWELLYDPAMVYEFYRGDLNPLHSGVYSHKMIDSAHCGIATNSTSVNDRLDGKNYYYLVSVRNHGVEGTLGNASSGARRPPANPACP